ncbi:MAG: diaminopimelate epimerase [Gammaproteobacteria bacterium]
MRQTAPNAHAAVVPFSKMEGLGNDFMVVDARGFSFDPPGARVRALADRRTGVGFDQLLVLEDPGTDDAAFAYRIWNADGEAVAQCGNGARCLAWLWARELSPGAGRFVMASPAGPVEATVEDGRVSVCMGEPAFDPARVPMKATSEAARYTIDVQGNPVELGAVSMGNPHAVIVVDDVAAAPVATLGPAVESHPAFPERVNVGFVQQLDSGHLALRVHERGCGETRACGTGACAAAAVLRDRGQTDPGVDVDLPGGRLRIRWEGRGHALWMSGPARKVFEGSVEA